MIYTKRKEVTIERIRERVGQLCSSFNKYIEEFDRANIFSGPSLYFHFRTLERLKNFETVSSALDDDLFLEYVYATLTAWGLHRMGPGKAKCAKFDVFINSIRDQENSIMRLAGRSLLSISDLDLSEITDDLWSILNNIKVSESETKLVANSKALHHILPDLMPPIDREYTLRFFYNNKTISGRDEQLFREIYTQYYRIGYRCRDEIISHVGRGFHTSETKIIDNAIVGFVLKEIK